MPKLARKPQWLDKKIDLKKCGKLKKSFRETGLHTVCEEAMCPNISECFSRGVATFLILGDTCTRNCSFCAVKKGRPAPPDPLEPEKVRDAVMKMDLKHVVITSVTRDDLALGGAEAFARTVALIKQVDSSIAVEVLVPDFKGDEKAICAVLESSPDIFAHNVETVPALYPIVRARADYALSLTVLGKARKLSNAVRVKSGLMLGLGENDSDVQKVFKDLRGIGCDYLSLGQYLAPSLKHFPVKEYVTPEKFAFYKSKAVKMGFSHVESGPYVRSSYMADRYGL